MQGYLARVFNKTMEGDAHRNVHSGVLEVYPGLYIGSTKDYMNDQTQEDDALRIFTSNVDCDQEPDDVR